jgi:hypothetical protein
MLRSLVTHIVGIMKQVNRPENLSFPDIQDLHRRNYHEGGPGSGDYLFISGFIAVKTSGESLRFSCRRYDGRYHCESLSQPHCIGENAASRECGDIVPRGSDGSKGPQVSLCLLTPVVVFSLSHKCQCAHLMAVASISIWQQFWSDETALTQAMVRR